ncbi:MAG TPA: formimidoylglutamase, partial [Vicinamibacterales bacterium]|nr:formimidoylglutamase [Vicinamibacterales bacterium]
MRSGDPDDVRVGDLLAPPDIADPAVALVGFPSDAGVVRNGGRAGAALAPVAIRTELARLTAGADATLRSLFERTIDLGDVSVSGDLEQDQLRLGSLVAPWLTRGVLVVVLGGGHETTYGHFLAYASLERDVSILNWDAHTDVRPLVEGRGHSGSPFRQALEHPSRRCRRYVVAGLQPPRVSAAHAHFIEQAGGACHWRDDMTADLPGRLLAELTGDTLVSFDIDAVDSSAAPGVSAPATNGLTTTEWLAAAQAAGRHPQTTSMDLVEVNPRVDIDGRTV